MAIYRGSKRYLGAWQYVLLDILYLLPGIGLIFLIVHCFSQDHENRRHYARSYFAKLLTIIVICGIGALVYYLVAGQQAFDEMLKQVTTQAENVIHIVNPTPAPSPVPKP